MSILIIGHENDIDFVRRSLKSDDKVTQVVFGNCSADAAILNFQTLAFYDCIVIAINDRLQSGNLRCLLEMILQDESRMIIDFYRMYYAMIPEMVVDRIMKNPFKTQYDGMILGISHAEVGILPQALDGVFCNLALGSQDIYYNMKTLEHCINNYKNKIQNLQYLIFDMFDYTYFNYDTSLSKNARFFYSHSGFMLDAHNFQNNKSFDYTFDDLVNVLSMQRYGDINDSQLIVWDELFGDVHAHNHYCEYNSYFEINNYLRTKVVTEEDVEKCDADTSIIQKIFYNTIHDNIQYFYDLLQLAYSINPSLKIFCILMPQYYAAQEKTKSVYAPWKEMFYTIIEEAKKIYPFTFLDLKENEIAQKRECFYDVSHLNYYGAIQFTKLLNTLIT